MKQATKLTNLQLELLKLFSREVTDQELGDIKRILAEYFSNKLLTETEKIWNENEWNDLDMDRCLKELS